MTHSAIYYRFDQNLVDDHTFDMWCKELVDLQTEYPEVAATIPFHEEFRDFDGSTGMQFSSHPFAVHKAEQLLRYNNML